MNTESTSRTSLIATAIVVLLALQSPAWPYEVETHAIMSEEAYKAAKLDDFLAEQLGISGTQQLPRGSFLFQPRLTPRGWLQEGSRHEDEPLRYVNHFYDPIYNRGLTAGIQLGKRSHEWGLEAPEAFPGQEFSYRDARRYFRMSLTEPDPKDRERWLTETFYTLGHVIHLIQDLASPAHTRNAMHVGSLGPFNLGPLSVVEKYLDLKDVRPGLKFNGYPIPREGSTQPRDFWAQTDANGNPQNGPSAWGLSQIINRNFVSEGTNFTTFVDGNHAAEYPDPVLSTATCREEFASTQDAAGQPITGFLMFCGNSFVDPNTGVLETNPRMTTFSLFSRDLRERGKTVPGGEFSLNALNAWSIGQLTIPRAVGYSAGLLDYFFRGKLEVRRGPHPETQEPSLRIVNRSPDALAKDGVFSLYQDTDKGVRSLAVEWPKLVEAVPQDNDAAPVYLPIPADLPTNGLTLVYQGKLGSEENAVIGKVLTETRIERIYLDWRTNEWMLQTADKLYALPLKTVAGLRFRPAEVEWGERDNQLVAYTFWSVDTFQALLFELERPLGSAQVPTTGAVTAQGHPVVALRLVQQIPLFETLGALDLGTTVEFTEHLDFTQYRVAFTVNSTCRVQDPPLFTYDTYNCASTFSDESLEPLRTLHDAVTARFPLALPRERFGWSPEWYAWNVQRVWADRNGHLVAAVQLQLAPLPGGESWRRFPLLTPWFGTPVESGYYASVQAKLEAPGASVLAVLDLTAGRLLAKTSEDLIRIEKTQRAVHPSPGFWGCYMDPRGETLYVGGTRDGQREPVLGALLSGCTSLNLIGSVVWSLAADAGTRLDHVEGVWQPALVPLGLGEAEVRDRPPEPVYVRYGYGGSPPVPLNLRVDRAVPVYLGPAVPSSWWNRLWWFGAAPGRLAFQADAREWSSRSAPGPGTERVWLVQWDLDVETASSVYSDTGAAVAEAVSGNPYGVFLVNESDRSWRWVPWSGAPLIFPDRNPAEAWDYVALDATRFLNVRTGQLHRLAPGLPPDLEAAPFPPGGTRWDAYHILGR